MAEWWMTDDQMSSQYRCAADKDEQIKIFCQICDAKRNEVLHKLVQIGSISQADFEEMLSARKGAKRKTRKEKADWMSLYNAGYSDAAIGQMTGATKCSVKSWRKHRGLEANNPALGADGIWRAQTFKNKSEAEAKK